MNRRRKTLRSLTDTRIYQHRKRFYLFVPEPILNPFTGRLAKWHGLCNIEEGEDKAREVAKQIRQYNKAEGGGDLPARMAEYLDKIIAERDEKAPKDPARRKMHDTRNRDIGNVCDMISKSLADFDVVEVQPQDVAAVVDQWEGRRMAEVVLSRLTTFFAWCCRKGLRNDNPCREVSVKKPDVREVYITDEQFLNVREALLTGADGKPTRSGMMIQCYVDLCYLLYQRTTEIRLLRWDQITDTGIRFKPTKTEKSSGATVEVPLTDELRAVLERAKRAWSTNDIGDGLPKVRSVYVIHTHDGQPYTTSGIISAWKRGCSRAEIKGIRPKDIRAKAATDAKKRGFAVEKIRVGLAHTNDGQTEDYIKVKDMPVSEVVLTLPKRKSS